MSWLQKRGEAFDVPMGTLVYLVLLVLVVFGATWYILDMKNASGLREDFYAKEFVRIINYLEPGAEGCLDVTRGMQIAIANGVVEREIIDFDNVKQTVQVRLRQGKGTTYAWLNDVSVVNKGPFLASGSATTNRWCFEIISGGAA